MEKYVVIGKAVDDKVVNRNIDSLEDSKNMVMKRFMNNPSIKSAILLHLSGTSVRIQLIKGNIEEFKRILDQQFPGVWQQDQKIIDLAA